MRELAWMAEGRERDEWERLSNLLALLRNKDQSDQSQLVTPWFCNPYNPDNRRPPKPRGSNVIAGLKAIHFSGDAHRGGLIGVLPPGTPTVADAIKGMTRGS